MFHILVRVQLVLTEVLHGSLQSLQSYTVFNVLVRIQLVLTEVLHGSLQSLPIVYRVSCFGEDTACID